MPGSPAIRGSACGATGAGGQAGELTIVFVALRSHGVRGRVRVICRHCTREVRDCPAMKGVVGDGAAPYLRRAYPGRDEPVAAFTLRASRSESTQSRARTPLIFDGDC